MPPKVLKYSMPLAKASAIARRGDHGAERMAVADRLAHRDDVGHGAVELRTTTSGPDPADPDLDLVGDATAPARARVLVRGREEARRRDDLAGGCRARTPR